MSIKSTILESIADIGVSALESHVEQTIEKAEIRSKLEQYIERQSIISQTIALRLCFQLILVNCNTR